MTLDALYRLAYRIGFPLARAWWFVRRPLHEGVLTAVWVNERVLMLRQSYRPRLTFPGGGLKRGEDPRAGAVREIREEIGLEAAAAALVLVRDRVVGGDFRRNRLRLFELRLAVEPALRIDHREVIEARFVEPAEALRHACNRFVAAYLATQAQNGDGSFPRDEQP